VSVIGASHFRAMQHVESWYILVANLVLIALDTWVTLIDGSDGRDAEASSCCRHFRFV